ncbi:hypothetical protein [Bacillus cereus]|uniref:hypothetical protein n=1 Tax=Bacillus cereus TaxID=1396 RepID=UPI0034D43D4B
MSKVLGLTLTTIRHDCNTVAQCGFPYHSLEAYLAKLIKIGNRVAVCESSS